MRGNAIFAILVLTLVASCGESEDHHPVVGTWDCEYIERDNKFNTEFVFRSDGTTAQQFTTSGSRNGTQVLVEGEIEGQWYVQGDKLVRKDKLSRTTYVEIDGQPLPRSEFMEPEEFGEKRGTVNIVMQGRDQMQMGTGVFTYCSRID